MDHAVARYLRRQHSLRIGAVPPRSSALPSAARIPWKKSRSRRWADWTPFSALPRRATITSEEIRYALADPLENLVEAVRSTLDQCAGPRRGTARPRHGALRRRVARPRTGSFPERTDRPAGALCGRSCVRGSARGPGVPRTFPRLEVHPPVGSRNLRIPMPDGVCRMSPRAAQRVVLVLGGMVALVLLVLPQRLESPCQTCRERGASTCTGDRGTSPHRSRALRRECPRAFPLRRRACPGARDLPALGGERRATGRASGRHLRHRAGRRSRGGSGRAALGGPSGSRTRARPAGASIPRPRAPARRGQSPGSATRQPGDRRLGALDRPRPRRRASAGPSGREQGTRLGQDHCGWPLDECRPRRERGRLSRPGAPGNPRPTRCDSLGAEGVLEGSGQALRASAEWK